MRKQTREWLANHSRIVDPSKRYQTKSGAVVKRLSICPELEKPVVAIVKYFSGYKIEQYYMNGMRNKMNESVLDLIEV